MSGVPKTIGILGGMGPEASLYFYRVLIRQAHETYGAIQDQDFPPIIIYNLPLRGFDEQGIVEPDLVRDQLIAGVQRLERAGADLVIIACNTVHVFQAEMQEALSIPLLSIVDETLAEARNNRYAKPGLLTSASSRQYQLYSAGAEKLGLTPIGASDTEQATLDGIILRVMAGEQGVDEARQLQAITERMVHDGADTIILGCTELPLAAAGAEFRVSVLNANEIIIARALQMAYGVK